MTPEDHAHALMPRRSAPLQIDRVAGRAESPRQLSHTIQPGLGLITALALHPDQTRLALCSGARVWLFDVATGTILSVLDHPAAVTSASFSQDEALLATGCNDAMARVWNLTTSTVVQTYSHPAPVLHIHLHTGGRHLATGCQDGMARLFTLGTDRPCQEFTHAHHGPVTRVFLNASMEWLLTQGSHGLDLWHIETGSQRSAMRPRQHYQTILNPPLGSLFAVGKVENRALAWDAPSGRVLRALEHPDTVTSIFLSQLDNSLLATACRDGFARLWDLESGTLRTQFHGHVESVTDVALSADGTQVFSCSEDRTAKLWDRSGRCLRTYTGHSSPLMAIVLSPDAKELFVAGYDPIVRCYSLDSGRCVRRFVGHTGGVSQLALSADGTRLATSSHDQTARVWEVASGQCLTTFEGHGGPVHWIAMTAQGTGVITSGRDRIARLWDASTGKERRFFVGHRNWIRCLALSPNESVLATGGDDSDVMVWDLETGACRATIHAHHDTVHALAFTPDGHLLTVSCDGTAKRLDLQTCRCLRSYSHPPRIRSLCLNTEGTFLATGGYDATIKLWDLCTDVCVRTFTGGHSDWIRSVVFTPDGKRLISAGRDGRVAVWDVVSGELLATLHHVHDGFLWTTPPDPMATNGWVWTDREELVEIMETDADGTNSMPIEETDQRHRDYLAMYNNQRRVMRRVQLCGQDDRHRMVALLGLHHEVRQSAAEIKQLTHQK